MQNTIENLQNMINKSKRIVFFGGAGVSTESGIPDFRGTDGLYSRQYEYPPEVILSHTFFMRQPEVFFRFYKNKMLCIHAKPNAAHEKLVQMERAGRLQAVITQNIDGLHQKAGSKSVFELHGSIHRNYCMRCKKLFDAQYMQKADSVPKCDVCAGVIKPDVVLYEEALDEKIMQASIRAIAQADCMIIAGTSLTVYPAAGMVQYFSGRSLVLINRDKTPLDRTADLVLHTNVGETLAQIIL